MNFSIARFGTIAILVLSARGGGVGAFLSMPRLSSPRTFNNDNKIVLHAFDVIDLSEVNAVVQSAEAVISPATAAATTTAAAAAVASGGTTITNSISTAMNSFFQTQPYLAAFLTCSFKASAADILAQTQEEPPKINQQQRQQKNQGRDMEGDGPTANLFQSLPSSLSSSNAMINSTPPPVVDVDISRNMGFLLYGGLYQGMAQNFLYSVVYPILVGDDGTGWEIVTTKVLIDNLIFAPFLCLPVAYIFKAAFSSSSTTTTTTTTPSVGQEEGRDELFHINRLLSQSIKKYLHDVTTNGLLIK